MSKYRVMFKRDDRYEIATYWDNDFDTRNEAEVAIETLLHPGARQFYVVEELSSGVEPVTATPAAVDTYDPPRLWNLLRATWAQGTVLPSGSAERKAFPIARGFDDYFPAAVTAVAGWSKMANNKHAPGRPLTHARGISGDHPDCQRRHQLDAQDPKRDRLEELTCKAWRALAELQEYAETLGAPPAPAATFPDLGAQK